jgi:hypothetical protein
MKIFRSNIRKRVVCLVAQSQYEFDESTFLASFSFAAILKSDEYPSRLSESVSRNMSLSSIQPILGKHLYKQPWLTIPYLPES